MNIRKKWKKRLALTAALFTAVMLLAVAPRFTYAANAAPELDYTFETVPVETVLLSADGVREIQPRQSFTVSYEVTPWYTTTSEIHVTILPESAARVTEASAVSVAGGKAMGKAKITVADDAVVGSTFQVIAGADGIESNALEVKVGKIPVTGLKLNLSGTDDKLHVGKTRTVSCEFTPSYATVKDVRYELSGSGVQYVDSFDEATGTIKAKDDIAVLDVNSTVTITAYSVDNPGAFDSVTLTLYIPSTVVAIAADTPLGRVTPDHKPLAVAASTYGDTVTLRAKVNGVDTTGLNYVIVAGQEYVENGYVQSNGTFALRPTAAWTEDMKVPHAEVKIRAAYSDGFDELTVSVYVPVERIAFVNAPPDTAENFRSYDLAAEAFPKYATLLADYAVPVGYSLNGLDASVAKIDGDGTLTLPKSLTSKGSVIRYSALLTNAWEGVDAAPLTHSVTVVPVYAKGFRSVKILKGGTPITDPGVSVRPSDVLSVQAEYTVDNVTDVDFSLSVNSSLLTASGNTLAVAPLQAMNADNPYLYVTAEYNSGGEYFYEKLPLSVYVPAVSAKIDDAVFKRGEPLDLNKLVTVNGHGFATNKAIEWGTPEVSGYTKAVTATCERGSLFVDSFATAGTAVRVPYRTADSDAWRYKEFTVAPLDGNFALSYGETFNDSDSRSYKIDPAAPQLETGQSVDLYVTYNGLGGAQNYGLSYSVEVTSNAELSYTSGGNASDTFTLSAKYGQSGRGNLIGYLIKITDGTETYSIRTADFVKPENALIDVEREQLSIFMRIYGEIGVSNETISENEWFSLTGWSNNFTFEKHELTWKISGGSMMGDLLTFAPERGFILTVSATQKYNGTDIPYSFEVTYGAIVYRKNASTVKKVYKKQGSSAAIAGRICHQIGFIQENWISNNNVIYEFGQSYSGNADLVLTANWVKTTDSVTIQEEFTLDENQNQNFYTYEETLDLNFDKLRSLGYTKIRVSFYAETERLVHNGRFAKMWMQLNQKQIWESGNFEPLNGSMYFTFDVDIANLSGNAVRLGFYTDDDGVLGKFTWKFKSADITFTALES